MTIASTLIYILDGYEHYQRASRTTETTKGEPVKFGSREIGRVEDDVSITTPGRDYRHFLQRVRLNQEKATELGSDYGYRLCYWSLTQGKGGTPG